MAAVSFSESVWSKEGIEKKLIPLYRELEFIEQIRSRYVPPFLPNLESRSELERGISVLGLERIEQWNIAYEKTDALFKLYLALYLKYSPNFNSLVEKISQNEEKQKELRNKLKASIRFDAASDIINELKSREML